MWSIDTYIRNVLGGGVPDCGASSGICEERRQRARVPGRAFGWGKERRPQPRRRGGSWARKQGRRGQPGLAPVEGAK